MANNSIQLQYDLRQNNNENNRAYGLWFPRVVRHGTLSLRGLSDHIADHGSIYTRDVVLGVLSKFTSCLVELVKQGQAVKIDGLGIFYPTLESSGAESAVGYNINEYVKGLHIRFNPDQTDLDDISSRQLAQKVSFSQRLIFDMNGVPKKVVNGELVDYGENDDDDGNGGGGNG